MFSLNLVFIAARFAPHTLYRTRVGCSTQFSGPDYSKRVLIIFLHRYKKFIVLVPSINFAIC
jgi:hypothetical protein